MRVRTVYFKVQNLDAAGRFWCDFLGMDPTKAFPEWQEFTVGGVNLGLLSFNDPPSTCREGKLRAGLRVQRR